MDRELDILTLKARADALIGRTASQLRELIHQAVGLLDPFPPFPGSFFTYAIEAEPGAAASPDRGCVVVCPDGEFYEFVWSMDFSGGTTDLASVRREEVKKLELPPQDYIVYAYNALTEIFEILEERQIAKG